MKSFLSMPQDKSILGIALGKFDGMHLGHQSLWKHLPKQSVLLCIENYGDSLTPYKEMYSPYPIVSINFEEIMQWDGRHFLDILMDKFPLLQKLVVGYDFVFGRDRAYKAEDLKHLFNGEVNIVPQFCINNISVHSSSIKTFINNGDMPNASAMLGRYYSIQGEVIKGQNLGSKALYATLNIQTHRYILPQNGVYASFTKIDNEILQSVCFVGNRLSTDGVFSIESHILDREISIKNGIANVYFVQKIRNNQKFNDLALLKEAISKDIIESKELLAKADMRYLI